MPSGQETFDFVIRAIDQVTAPMRAIANAVRGVGGAAGNASPASEQLASSINHIGHAAAEVGKGTHGISAVAAAAERVKISMNGAARATAHVTAAAMKAGHAAVGIGKATQGIEAVAKAAGHVKASMNGAAHAAHGAAHAAGEVTAHNRGFLALAGHVHLLREHFGELNIGIGEVGHSLTEFLPMLGALGAAGSLVGLFEMTEHASEVRSESIKMSKELGVSTKELGALRMAAKLSDVSVESMQAGMAKLNVIMGQASHGQNKKAAALFEHIGLKLRDSKGNAAKLTDVLPRLADAFAHTKDQTILADAAQVLFGKGGKELIAMLKDGSEGLHEYAEAAAQVNFAPTGEQSQDLEEYHKSWILLQSAVSGFENEVGAQLAPVLRPVLDTFKEWIVANRHWVATAITGRVKELVGWLKEMVRWLKTVDWTAVIKETREWGHWLWDLGGNLGGVTVALGALTLALGSPLLSGLRSAIEIFSTFGRTLLWVSAVAWANPIILAAAGVALAGWLIYKNWDLIGPKLKEVTDSLGGLKAALEDLAMISLAAWGASMTGVLTPVRVLVTSVAAAVRDLAAAISETLVGSVGTFQTALDGLNLNPAFRALATTLQIYEKLKAPIEIKDIPAGSPLLKLLPPGAAKVGEASERPGMVTPGAEEPFFAPPLPSPYHDHPPPMPGAPAGTPQDGKLHVQIDVNNMPPGSKVTAQTSGAAQTPDLNVGYAYPAFAY